VRKERKEREGDKGGRGRRSGSNHSTMETKQAVTLCALCLHNRSEGLTKRKSITCIHPALSDDPLPTFEVVIITRPLSNKTTI
jgi:hypothetical protein